MALFRVLQEALTNVHRHAHASTVDISLERKVECVTLQIKDNGHGIARERLQQLQELSSITSVGVAGMQERLRELSGALDIQSDHSGTVVKGIIPLPSAKNQSTGLRQRKTSRKSAHAA